MNTLWVFVVLATCTSVRAMVCYHGICDHLKKQMPLQCKGSIIKNGGFCGCVDVCAKVEDEVCQAEFIRGRMPEGTCDQGLTCQKQLNMMIGLGKCVKADQPKPVSARATQTLCERRRIQSMIVMVVYPGQWFPTCDVGGLFKPQQCDNQGMCFCVNVHSGEVDELSKVHGPATCETNAVQARSEQTQCQRHRIQSMIVQIVYAGQWFPKCDAEGLYEPEQCDNQGMCFCVNAHSGAVDVSSKVKGSADCDNHAIQVRSEQTQCQRHRIQSMIVQIVYAGQWFPKCDVEGLYEPEQCDNQGMCFCVNVHSGAVDVSSKVKGSADCENQAVQARETLTYCEQMRRTSLISMVVYPGQWLPKCDAQGMFEPEQCDNTGHCFCVDVSTGTVDMSTKVVDSPMC